MTDVIENNKNNKKKESKTWIEMTFDERMSYVNSSIDVLVRIKASNDSTDEKIKKIMNVLSYLNPKCSTLIDYNKKPITSNDYTVIEKQLAKLGMSYVSNKTSIELNVLQELLGLHRKKYEADRQKIFLIEDIKYFVSSEYLTEWYRTNINAEYNDLQSFRNDLISYLSNNDFEIWKKLILATTPT